MGISEILRGLGGPVAYHPALAKHVGGVKPAILLCQLIYWSGKTDRDLGVYKSTEEWERETGLSYREQATARRELVSRGLMIETSKRLEHKIYFLLVQASLDELLVDIATCGKRISRNAESAFGGTTKAHFVHTENTTEITTENKTSAEPQAAHVPYEKILAYYNEICVPTFKGAPLLTDERRKNIQACWKYKVKGNHVFQSAGFWKTFFERCLLNSHWRGENDRGWKASLEFITRKSTMERVVSDMLAEDQHNAA